MSVLVLIIMLIWKRSLSRQAKASLDLKIRHRINAGRSAVKNEIVFLVRHLAKSEVTGS